MWFQRYQSRWFMYLVVLELMLGISLGWSEEPSPLLPSPITGESVTIQMESYSLTPHAVSAEVGKPIEFLLKNESFLVPHNFLLDSPEGVRLMEVNVDSGEEARISFTPPESGTYPFYCDKQLLFFPTHREEGMEGLLTVR